jgi:AraC family transcriptional regulator
MSADNARPEIINSFDYPRYVPGKMEGNSLEAGWGSLFMVCHRQPSQAQESPRPATADHQLVLFCGAHERGDVSLNNGPWKSYEKRCNEWYIGPSFQNRSAWSWRTNDREQEDSLILRLFLPHNLLVGQSLDPVSQSLAHIELLPKMGLIDPFMTELALQLRRSLYEPSSLDRLLSDSVATLLSIHLLRNYCSNPIRFAEPQGRLGDRRRNQIEEYVRANLGNSLSLDDLAAQACMSKFHFARIFKNTFGIPPHQFVRRCRIEKAEELLRNTSLPITRIAEDIGFDYIGNMARAFKKATGLTPMDYRNQFKLR